MSFPAGSVSITCLQCRRPEFDPWVRKDPQEYEMATHSSILAWEIPWTEDPEGLQSMGVTRVGYDSATKPPLPCHILKERVYVILRN